MNKLILEEIQRMTLLSKYDNSKTLSEQKELDEYTYTVQNGKTVPAGETAKQIQTLQPQKTPAQAAPVQKPLPIPLQLKDQNGVKAFQDWLDINAKGWASGYKDGIINKGQNGGGYGKFGPRTQKAWATAAYKNKYLQSVSPQALAPQQAQTLPAQTTQPQQVQAPTNQQTTVTSATPPTNDEEITLQPRK